LKRGSSIGRVKGKTCFEISFVIRNTRKS